MNTSQKNRVWIEDDILYNEFQGKFNFDLAFAVEEKSLVLIKEHGKNILPLVIILKDITDATFDLPVSDYGKMVTSFNLIHHVSGIWVVGATRKVYKLVTVMNKMFFHNKIYTVNSVEKAQQQIMSHASQDKNLLDRE